MQFRYSMIDSFVSCPSKFYSTYVLGQREEVKSPHLEFGTAVHMALNSHFEGEDPYDMFNTYWNSVEKMKLEYDRQSWEDLRAVAVDRFLPNFLRLHAKKFTNNRLEETIEVPFLGSHTLQGTFDLVGEYEGQLTMVDFKTSAREYPVSKIHRNPQMYIYSYLYLKKYGVMPKQVMYKVFIKTEGRIQSLKLPLTEEKLMHIMGNVEAICKNMLRMVEERSIYSNYNCYCGKSKECFK